jgi:hypothetical protein
VKRWGDIRGLTGRLWRSIWKPVGESSLIRRRIDRRKTVIKILLEAEKAAHSRLGDSMAKAMLADCLDADSDSINSALALLAGRNEYVSDRARRLLSAVHNNSQVPQMPRELAGLFVLEETLGRMPLKEAFHHLTELEPRLATLGREIENGQVQANRQGSGFPSKVSKELADLVGTGARGDDVVLHSSLAASLVRQYLEIKRGATSLGDVDTAYFDAPLKIRVRVGRA